MKVINKVFFNHFIFLEVPNINDLYHSYNLEESYQ